MSGGLRLVIAAAIILGVGGQTDNTYTKDYSSFATQLRADKLDGYDPRVPPPMDREGPIKSGVDVDMSVDIFKLQNVDLAEGTLALKVWFRLVWVDQRLAWDPASYGGIRQTWYAAGDVPNIEANEIWSPDFSVYNSAVTIGGTMDAELARVSHNGQVRWARPGTMEVLCKYSDIVNFPLDKPECKIEIGGWALSGNYQGIRKANLTYNSIPARSSQSSYAKFLITGTTTEVKELFVPAYPDEKWPIMVGTIKMRRANWFSWILITTLPTIFLAYLATVVAFLPPECGERLGYGITLIVALEVGKVVLVGIIPVAGEILQNDILTLISVMICYFSLFETTIVLFLYYYEEKHLVPEWTIEAYKDTKVWFKECWKRRIAALQDSLEDMGEVMGKKQTKQTQKATRKLAKFEAQSEWDVLKANDPDDGKLDEWDDSGAAILYRSFRQWSLGHECKEPSSSDLELIWSNHYKREAKPATRLEESSVEDLNAAKTSGANETHVSPERSELRYELHNERKKTIERMRKVKSGENLDDDGLKRLLYFEELFFALDAKCQGWVDTEDLTRLLSYLALDMTASDRNHWALTADDSGDGKISRPEFLEICLEKLWTIPTPILVTAGKNFATAQKIVSDAPNNYWKEVARTIDAYYRIVLPVSYSLALSIIYNVSFDDGYTDEYYPMWEGFEYKRVFVNGPQALTMFILPIVIIVGGLSWFAMYRKANQRLKQKTADARKKSLEITKQSYKRQTTLGSASLGSLGSRLPKSGITAESVAVDVETSAS